MRLRSGQTGDAHPSHFECRSHLTQSMEGRLAEGAALPDFQPQQIVVKGRAAPASAPKTPATDTVLRFVYFVDCRRGLPLNMVALDCPAGTTAGDMKAMLQTPGTGVPKLVRQLRESPHLRAFQIPRLPVGTTAGCRP